MTIEQGIQLCEYSAKTNEILMKRYDDASGYTRSGNAEIRTTDAKTFEKRAEEHRQLATWLRELKERREQTSDDCISRQEVLYGLASIAKAKAKSDAQKSLMGRVMFFTEQLPPVNPQPKTGHWIIIDDCELFMAKCSECGEIVDSRMISKYPYCHCGARMVDPQESEE